MDPELATQPMQAMEQPIVPEVPTEPDPQMEEVVRAEILKRIDDSLSIERDWRTQGQKIQQIYKGELGADGLSRKGRVRYNILNSNVSILLPSVFQRAPKPVVTKRGQIPSPAVDQACTILQMTCETLLDTSEQKEALKAAVKEVLLPGRGYCRVRWDPIVKTEQVEGPMGPMDVHEKLLDQLYVEHVYWEDFTHEHVPQWADCGWMAFRHLFIESEFMEAFGDTVAVQKYAAEDKLRDIFKWTDAAANKATGGDTVQRSGTSTSDLQDVIQKALVWEYWDKSTREVIWICADMQGQVLRIDPDLLKLRNFFPGPKPLLGVTTTNTTLPTAEYVIYQDLAVEIDETSDRINELVKRIKVVGAYNASMENLADILTQDDGEMIGVNGMDLDHELKKHIYWVDIAPLVQALQILYQTRDQAKQAMYEVTGISDIVRGQTKASETLGAQRIKSAFASLRIQDRKDDVETFCADIIGIMGEIIAEHFSPESLFYYSGIAPMPETIMMLKQEGLRNSRMSVESDSTAAPDEEADQEAMTGLFTALGGVMQQIFPLVMQGLMPIPIAIELLKFATKPFKFSRELSVVLDMYVQQLMAMPPQSPQPAQGGQNEQQAQ